MKRLRQHFDRYRTRKPWDFCWRIAIEGTVVALAAAVVMAGIGVADREMDLSVEEFVVLGVLVAPILETLIFQAFPVWIARLFKARLRTQIIFSLIPFFAVHAVEGVATGIAAGLFSGFYLAFTYAHWRNHGRWVSFWVTAVSHSIHNAIVISLAIALGEI